MSSSTSVSQRLYILLSVLVALTPLIGTFLMVAAEFSISEGIAKYCLDSISPTATRDGTWDRLWNACYDKAKNEQNFAFWQYALLLVPAVALACGAWVLGISRPLFTLSSSWLYLVAEAFLVVVGILLASFLVYTFAVESTSKIVPQLRMSCYVLAVVAPPWILTLFLERNHAEHSYKVLRLGVLIVLLVPVALVAIAIFR